MLDRTEVIARKIVDLDGAKQWIKDLCALSLDFHFEDDPAEVVTSGKAGSTFTRKEVPQLRDRQIELYAQTWSDADGGCPIGFMLQLHPTGDLP